MKTKVNSIEIPNRFVRACIGWEGGMDCMLRAVTSTGNLTIGTIRPMGCITDEKWYLHLWRELSCDLSSAVLLADDSDNGDDATLLAEFEEWVEDIVGRLEVEYNLVSWEAF